MYKKYLIFSIAALFATAAYVAMATGLGLGVSGKQVFHLNDKVGSQVLKFDSSAPLEDITGTVKSSKYIKSTVTIDPDNLEKTSGEVSFKVVGIETGIDTRNEHLQSDVWLGASKHPDITYKLTGLKNVKASASGGKTTIKATATGSFSVHGKSKKINAPVEITYLKESAKTKKRAPGALLMVKGGFEIALADYDIKGKEGIVGSKVGETIDISFSLFYNSK